LNPVFEVKHIRVNSWRSSAAVAPRNQPHNFFMNASFSVDFIREPVEQRAAGISNASILLKRGTCRADHAWLDLRAVVVDTVRLIENSIVGAYHLCRVVESRVSR